MDKKEYEMFKLYMEEIDIEGTIYDAVYTAVTESLENAVLTHEDASDEDIDKILSATGGMIKQIIEKIKFNK